MLCSALMVLVQPTMLSRLSLSPPTPRDKSSGSVCGLESSQQQRSHQCGGVGGARECGRCRNEDHWKEISIPLDDNEIFLTFFDHSVVTLWWNCECVFEKWVSLCISVSLSLFSVLKGALCCGLFCNLDLLLEGIQQKCSGTDESPVFWIASWILQADFQRTRPTNPVRAGWCWVVIGLWETSPCW